GLLDRVPQIDGAVAALLPALEVAPVEIGAAGAVDLEVRRDHALFERRQPDSHLERGAGRVAALDGPILQGPQVVRVQPQPRGAIDAGSKGVRIVRRPAAVAENFTGLRI